MNYQLWYQKSTEDWLDGLPIGNGRLAAMVVSGENADRLALNHEELWDGLHRYRTTEPVYEHLREIRRLIREEKIFEATALANLYFGGHGGMSGLPSRVCAYQPAGDLVCRIKGNVDFEQRSLDIRYGVAEAVRKCDENEIISQAFISCAEDKLFFRMQAEKPFDAEVGLDRKEDIKAHAVTEVIGNILRLKCSLNNVKFEAAAAIYTDGIISGREGTAVISNASSIMIVLDIAVDGTVNAAERYDFDAALEKHKERFCAIMDAVRFQISDQPGQNTTDEELRIAKNGGESNYLAELYFHYGRYLLVSSSVCGRLPANLQGKWNEDLEPAWKSDYHFDINLQMNYWPAEPCGMTECAEALLQYIESFYESGEKAAKDLYGCRGIFLPLQGDAWAKATPESYGWAVWIGAAAWIGQHFWAHYIYSGDLKFLKERAYPYFVKTAEFYEDYLQEDEEGILQIIPSQSPENKFVGTGNFPVSIGMSSAMDIQLAHDALTYAVNAAEILDEDADRVKHWKKMLEKLPPLKIGRDERLLEWDKEREEEEPGHRHLSHLYGLYPSDLLVGEEYKNEYAAAVKSLYGRLSSGGGHTGWSRAWVACLMARIGDKDGFYEHFCALFKTFVTNSLLDLHPPKIFQIDGNLGAAAAVIEALISCCNGRVYLLRALPKQWANGTLKGIKTPGGHTLDMEWKNGELTFLQVKFGFEGKISFGETAVFSAEEYTGAQGEVVRILW